MSNVLHEYNIKKSISAGPWTPEVVYNVYCCDNLHELPLPILKDMMCHLNDILKFACMSRLMLVRTVLSINPNNEYTHVYSKYKTSKLENLSVGILTMMIFHIKYIYTMRTIEYDVTRTYKLSGILDPDLGLPDLYPIIITETKKSRMIIRTRK